jgi:hypothetical protein
MSPRSVRFTLLILFGTCTLAAGCATPNTRSADVALTSTQVGTVVAAEDGQPVADPRLNDRVRMMDVPFIDGYSPSHCIPMQCLQRTPAGAYRLLPGMYAIEVESYHVSVGLRPPGNTDGYVYADDDAAISPLVSNLLRRSLEHPEIPQKSIQLLVWSILAGMDVQALVPTLSMTTAEMLSPAEILQLNAEATERKSRSASDEFERAQTEAEQAIRERLRSGAGTFEAYQRIAAPLTIAARDLQSRPIPAGRWSYHPDGYFIRFLPIDNSSTRIECYVPEQFTIQRDTANRITAVIDNAANQMRFSYNQAYAPLPVGGDAGVWGFPITDVEYVQTLGNPPDSLRPLMHIAASQTQSWTLAGVPNGVGRARPSGYPGFANRYAAAWRLVQETRALAPSDSNNSVQTALLRDALDLANLRSAMIDLLGDPAIGSVEASFLERITNASQAALARYLKSRAKTATSDTTMDAMVFDPATIVAIPGNRSRSPIALSPRIVCPVPAADSALQHIAATAIGSQGGLIAPADVATDGSGSSGMFVVRFGPGDRVLRYPTCRQLRTPGTAQQDLRRLLVGRIRVDDSITYAELRSVPNDNSHTTAVCVATNGTGEADLFEALHRALEQLQMDVAR